MIICCQKNTYFLVVAIYYYTLQRYVDFIFSLMSVPFIWDSHDVSRFFIRTPKNQAMRSLSLNKLPYLVFNDFARGTIKSVKRISILQF